MAKQVMDIQNSHGISQGESDEKQRNWSEKQWRNKLQMSGRNYDYTRRNLNFEIFEGKVQRIDTSKSIDQKMREMCAARGMRWPNDPNPRRKPGDDDSKVKERNVAASFIFEGSRERMHEIAFGGYGVVDLSRGADNSHVQRRPEIEQWALDTYNWVGRKFGFENIAGFYVHLDETNPHIHCDILPVAMVKGKERVSYNKVFGDPSKEGNQQKWRAFHDSYYEEVGSKWGLDRGDDIQVTGAKHKTYEEYQKDLGKDVKKLETKVKGLTSMVHNLEDRQNKLEVEISYLEHDVGVNQEALDVKRQELKEVQEQLDKKKASLDDAKQQLQEFKKEIGDKNEEAKQLSSLISDLRSDLQKLQGQERTLSTKVKGLTTMIANLENKQSGLISQIEIFEHKLESEKGGEEKIRSVLEDLRRELVEVNGKLADKRGKLEDAEKQLADARSQLSGLDRDRDEMRRSISSLNDQLWKTRNDGAEIAKSFVGAACLEDAVREYSSIRPQLSRFEQPKFDGSVIDDLATKGQDVMICATLLFLGALDEATNFAQSHGGGGGGSDLPWGRDPNEDDRMWALRCARQARKMLKPVQQRIKR